MSSTSRGRRSTISTIGAVAATGLLLAACSPAGSGGGDSTTSSGGGDSSSDGGSSEQTTVTFRLWDEAAAKAYETSFAEFEKEHA